MKSDDSNSIDVFFGQYEKLVSDAKEAFAYSIEDSVYTIDALYLYAFPDQPYFQKSLTNSCGSIIHADSDNALICSICIGISAYYWNLNPDINIQIPSLAHQIPADIGEFLNIECSEKFLAQLSDEINRMIETLSEIKRSAGNALYIELLAQYISQVYEPTDIFREDFLQSINRISSIISTTAEERKKLILNHSMMNRANVDSTAIKNEDEAQHNQIMRKAIRINSNRENNKSWQQKRSPAQFLQNFLVDQVLCFDTIPAAIKRQGIHAKVDIASIVINRILVRIAFEEAKTFYPNSFFLKAFRAADQQIKEEIINTSPFYLTKFYMHFDSKIMATTKFNQVDYASYLVVLSEITGETFAVDSTELIKSGIEAKLDAIKRNLEATISGYSSRQQLKLMASYFFDWIKEFIPGSKY